MIHINGIDHINLEVPNLEETKKFYESIFGLEVKEDYEISTKDGKVRRFILIGISDKIMLCLYENKAVDLKTIPLNHIGVNVSNFDEAFEVAKKKEILDEKWGMIEYKYSRSFYILDPNGLGIEVSEKFGGGH